MTMNRVTHRAVRPVDNPPTAETPLKNSENLSNCVGPPLSPSTLGYLVANVEKRSYSSGELADSLRKINYATVLNCSVSHFRRAITTAIYIYILENCQSAYEPNSGADSFGRG